MFKIVQQVQVSQLGQSRQMSIQALILLLIKYCTYVMHDQLYIHNANYDDFECHSVKRPPRYNSQLDLAPR